MSDSVTARAQADESLEQVAKVLKRLQGIARTALQETRQAQATLKGVQVETTADGGTDGRSEIETEA